jgi:hypothetical protein
MTKLLQEAWARVSKLSDDEQDRIARELLEELEEAEWDLLIAHSGDALKRMAEEARAEYEAGETEPLDPETL